MNDDEIINKIVSENIKLYQVEKIVNGDIEKATTLRRKALEKIAKVSLKNIGNYPIDMSLTASRNIENPIGCASIPIGCAGPLKVNGEFANGSFYIPLCTTEGALVASVNRGCSIITNSGGSNVKILKNQMARAPVFKILAPPYTEHAQILVKWIKEHFDDLVEVFKKVDPFAFLKDIQSWIVGRSVFIRFLVFSADAMGMNMITTGSRRSADFIVKNAPVRCQLVATSGNMCVDKKPSALNYILGRGKTVQAEVILPKDYIKNTLKTTPEGMAEVVFRKIYIGTGQAAAYGLNAHVANIIAAIFLATGQDAAQVVESSMGIVTAELLDNNDLYMSLLLPSLEIGTTGGGTHLPTQREALSILGCAGFYKDKPPGTMACKFAEIITSTALAGEISLCAALSAGHLASTHEKLGRGKKS
ncbi:MAG: hydroxymethylglutaryl-CoA reductase (NADPH) [Candidatus Helarchaeota archaeon]